MKPFFEETRTSYRALLSNAEDVADNGEQAEVMTTRWYDKELPMDELIKEAKENDKDVITIETETITQRSYEVQ